MTAGKYLKDKLPALALNAAGLFLLCLYLTALNNSLTTVSLIAAVWLLTLCACVFLGYRGRKRYFDRIEDMLEHLEHPYLIAELMENSWSPEDRLYRDILRRSNKAVIERIEALDDTQKEYREFIEGWIHEVKLPLTALRLAYYNRGQREGRGIEAYLTQIDNAVERVLFYARSDQVFKDYQVAETEIQQIALGVIGKNKYLLMHNGMSARAECGSARAVTDGKWLEFILTQILSNAVKYKKEEKGEIAFIAEETESAVRLRVRDAGIGIPEEELGRIFEKGFTGSNGRSREKSTGIGLYLCAKLCRKLEIGISAESVLGGYTEISLMIPKGGYLSKLLSS